MKKKFGIMALLLMLIACFTFGLVACTEEEENTTGKNPRVVIETDELELALEIFSDYKMPFAGIYDQNLDRVDGKELWMSVLDPNGDYYVSPTMDYETISFIETGKYEIVYTASGCASAKITVYVCERLDQAINFKVEGNTLTWDSVYGASGYEVTVNGQEPIFTENASFTSDIFAEEGFYVGVTSKGDNKTWIDSYMKSYENRVALKEGDDAKSTVGQHRKAAR